MTREDFITAYEAALKIRWPWASNADQLKRYMGGVRDTLFHGKNTWICDGECVRTAWSTIGQPGKPNLKKIRALKACADTDTVTASILPGVERELLHLSHGGSNEGNT